MLPIKNPRKGSNLMTKVYLAELHYRLMSVKPQFLFVLVLLAAGLYIAIDINSRSHGKVQVGFFLEAGIDETNLKVGNELKSDTIQTAVAAMDMSEPEEDYTPDAQLGLVSLPLKLTTNEAAPLPTEYIDGKSQEAYIKKYAKLAQAHQRKHGIPASISLAQGLIESRAGTSKLAKSNNNHFGIKCFSKSCKKGHCSNFADDTHKDFFRKFKRPEDSWEAHAILLKKPNYKKCYKSRDYKHWAYGLKAGGYATDSKYATTLIGVIKRYKLYKYD